MKSTEGPIPMSGRHSHITHWGRHKMTANFLTTMWNAFIFKWKSSSIDSNVTEVCSRGSNQQKANTGSLNVLVLNRRQAIIWHNSGVVFWRLDCLTTCQAFRSPQNQLANLIYTLIKKNPTFGLWGKFRSPRGLDYALGYHKIEDPVVSLYIIQWRGDLNLLHKLKAVLHFG